MNWPLPTLLHSLAQTTPPQPTPAELELLKEQISFLKEANATLADSFVRYVNTVNASITIAGFVLTAITLLGTVVFGKSLWDFRRTLQGVNTEVEQRVRQKVEQEVALVVQNRIDKLEAILTREITLSRVTLTYLLPAAANTVNAENVAFALRVLQARGFQTTPRYLSALQSQSQTELLPDFSTDVVVLDLTSTAFSDSLKEDIITRTLTKIRKQQTALIVYSPGYFNAVKTATNDSHFCNAANSPLTLVARVIEAGYVADAAKTP